MHFFSRFVSLLICGKEVVRIDMPCPLGRASKVKTTHLATLTVSSKNNHFDSSLISSSYSIIKYCRIAPYQYTAVSKAIICFLA